MSSPTPMLELQGVSAAYGAVRALHDIDLRVDAGEIVCLIGSNGAGKSSTLLACTGILRPRTGRIRFAGVDITALPTQQLVGRGLALVPEGRRIFPRLTVEENLRMGAYGIRDAALRRDSLERAWALFPILAERRHQAGGTLSGGEQQMLAIARALQSRPRLLLLDEPSMGVAPLLVQRIFDAIRALHREGLAILLVEQNARLALGLAQRAYVLETGRIVLHDQAQVLLHDPRVQAAYLGA